MVEGIVAVAGAVSAGACCVAPSRWRARVVAVVMALGCLPWLPAAVRLVAALVLVSAAVVLAAGLRRRTEADRPADLHRALGGVLMGGMLLLGGHGAGSASDAGMLSIGAHHSGVLSPHPMLALAVLLYLVWSLGAIAHAAHRSNPLGRGAPAPRAARSALAVERIGMAVMFAAAVTGMGLA